jgi:hypothetical protein
VGRLDRGLLYARTVRHLRLRQWVYWPLRRLQRGLPGAPPATAGALSEARATRLAEVVAGWGPGDPEARLLVAEEVAAGRFRFLNHAETLPAVDWRRRHVSHLWSYNLHYFDYAVDLAWAWRLTGDGRFPRRFAELAEGWISGTDPGRGDGWEPYALSVRVVNWSYALLLFGGALPAAAGERVVRSLLRQCARLERRLEWHLLANHLQRNFQALAVAGVVLDGAGPARWRRTGVEGLWREIREQVLPDGGHFERSPMYHAVALADLLETTALVRAAGEAVPAGIEDRLRRMARAYGLLCRADGSLHLFNDAANGIAPARARILALARSVLGEEIADPAGAFALPETGFFGYANPATGERLLVDCGEPGPAYQPGHAHCDLLSFELDLAGRPVVVDSGTSGYEGDPLREYARSTRAHSTVAIAGREQSEVWGTFRVGRRARVLGGGWEETGDACRFSGAYRPHHDRGAMHLRTLERREGAWTVTDRVEGAVDAPLAGWLHLHPDFAVEVDGTRAMARAADLTLSIEAFGVDRVRVVRGESGPAQGWYSPEFGVALPAPVLELVVDRNRGEPFGYTVRAVNPNA